MKFDVDIKSMIRRLLILLLVSAVCLGLLVCVFTNIGTHALFRLGVYLNLEDVDVGDNAHLEYYDVKAHINDTDSYRIFLDSSKSSSLDAALDFLKFIKQNTDVNIICMDVSDVDGINAFLDSGDRQISVDGLSDLYKTFLQKLSLYNQMLPPQKRVHVVNTHGNERCFIIADRAYDKAQTVSNIVDVSVIYPQSEDCDPLFNVDWLKAQEDKIRFGTVERLGAYIRILEAVSGNFGMPEFNGVNQPDYYFIIENVTIQGEAE